MQALADDTASSLRGRRSRLRLDPSNREGSQIVLVAGTWGLGSSLRRWTLEYKHRDQCKTRSGTIAVQLVDTVGDMARKIAVRTPAIVLRLLAVSILNDGRPRSR